MQGELQGLLCLRPGVLDSPQPRLVPVLGRCGRGLGLTSRPAPCPSPELVFTCGFGSGRCLRTAFASWTSSFLFCRGCSPCSPGLSSLIWKMRQLDQVQGCSRPGPSRPAGPGPVGPLDTPAEAFWTHSGPVSSPQPSPSRCLPRGSDLTQNQEAAARRGHLLPHPTHPRGFPFPAHSTVGPRASSPRCQLSRLRQRRNRDRKVSSFSPFELHP